MNAYFNSLDRGIANGITANSNISYSQLERKYFVTVPYGSGTEKIV